LKRNFDAAFSSKSIAHELKNQSIEERETIHLVGGLEHFYFSIQLGMSSSQLTFTPSFFRGVGQPPTRYVINHH
jgi:hypothetical protein